MVQKKHIETVDVNASENGDYHTPVMLSECIESLNIQPNGIYVDCTFGGGGHSRAMLEKLGEHGKLIAFDQDEDAKANVPKDERVLFVPQNFRYLKKFLRLHQFPKVDGILADLGVSSHQFDVPERGFSIRFDAALDMRMDQRGGKTAADVLQTFTEQQLHKMFERYGEVTNAKTLARTIVNVREVQPLKTVSQFKQSIQEVVKGNPNKYFAQVFQALRIEVNEELIALEELLVQSVDVLKPGGRIAIITFHSLEDRIVKQFFKTGTFTEPETDAFGRKPPVSLQVVTKKPLIAGEKELKMNNRSRSAKLRVAEKK